MCSSQTRKKCWTILGLLITVICFMLQFVSLVTDQWQIRETANSTSSFRSGIWFSRTNDIPTDNDEDAMIACQIFGILGAVMMLECLRMETAVSRSEGCRKNDFMILILINVIGLVCMLVEFLVYVISTGIEGAQFDYSCIMTIAAFLLVFVRILCCIFELCECPDKYRMDWMSYWGIRSFSSC